MRQDKIFRLLAGVLICSLLLAAGCAQPLQKPAEPEKQLPKAAEEKAVIAPAAEAAKPSAEEVVTVALHFAPNDSATYRLVTEAERGIVIENAPPNGPNMTGGVTGNRTEITFTQQIQSCVDRGNAVANITIKELKYATKVKNNFTVDFDSSREKDKNSSLARLVGQSYTIEITPAGRVSKVIDASKARAAVAGGPGADRTIAMELVDPNAIRDRHSILPLPPPDKNQLRTGDSWSSVKTLAFGMMGAKSYERVYTLKEVEDTRGRQVAVVEMKAIPTSQTPETEDEKKVAKSDFSKMFDNTETFTGRMTVDLTCGHVERYLEEIHSQWVAVEPADQIKDNKEPIILKMSTTLSQSIEKLD
jgi:hypothetical protein